MLEVKSLESFSLAARGRSLHRNASDYAHRESPYLVMYIVLYLPYLMLCNLYNFWIATSLRVSTSSIAASSPRFEEVHRLNN
jgi:hypothetical protein